MTIFTIGFTKRSAEKFFEQLRQSGAVRLIDIRLNNVSQLAGFSKRDDLKYFLKTICEMDYIHLPILAPTQDILDEFKKKKGDWDIYENKFLSLMESRQIEKVLSPTVLDNSCLLCSEFTPDKCHRRLVAEYLQRKWNGVDVIHL